MIRLLRALQVGQGDNADGLAASCGVSRRTVFRDLEELRKAGVPLIFDKRKDQYALRSDYFQASSSLQPDEAAAILALASHFGADQRLPFFRSVRTASEKIRRSLPESVRKEVDFAAKTIHLRRNLVSQLPRLIAAYERLFEAVLRRRAVRIEYRSLTEWELIATRLRPYQLLFSRHSWYVIGRSSYHGEPRIFNLARIESLEVLDESFSRPRGFSVERYLGNAWELINEPGPDQQVCIRFSELVARNVAEVAWHKTQRLEPREDGSLDFHATVSGLNEIAWWILGYGDQAEVLKPAKLRRLVAQRIASMSRIYGLDSAPAASPNRPGRSRS